MKQAVASPGRTDRCGTSHCESERVRRPLQRCRRRGVGLQGGRRICGLAVCLSGSAPGTTSPRCLLLAVHGLHKRLSDQAGWRSALRLAALSFLGSNTRNESVDSAASYEYFAGDQKDLGAQDGTRSYRRRFRPTILDIDLRILPFVHHGKGVGTGNHLERANSGRQGGMHRTDYYFFPA